MRAMKNVVGMALALSLVAAVGFAGPPQTVDYSAAGAPPRFYSETYGQWAKVEDGTATIREQTVMKRSAMMLDKYHVRAEFTAIGEDPEDPREYTGTWDRMEVYTGNPNGAMTGTITTRISLTCQDGIVEQDHEVEHHTVNANGDIVVNFVK